LKKKKKKKKESHFAGFSTFHLKSFSDELNMSPADIL
jgi:hypothetical protein